MPKNTYEPNHYQASEIKVLEGLEPVRKRPGMYIGSTDSRGLHHLAKEILDNAVDETIAGYGKRIQLFRNHINDIQQSLINQLNIPVGDESITVADNGRGIPVDMHASGVSALEVVLTKLHAGGKFEETAYQASGGLHGVGSSAVNALSAVMQVIVKRDKKYHYQWYSRGIPQIPVSVISEAEVQKLFPEQSKRFITKETGTLLSFIPDPTIFPETQFSHKTLVEVIKDRAYLMAGVYFELTDEVEDSHQHYYFENGIRSLVEHINMNRKPLHSVAYSEGVWKDDNTGKSIAVEVALQFNDSFKERLDSYVNVINTPDGGAHVNGFRMALSRVLRDYAEKHELIKEKESFTAEDLKEGMSAVVFVKMPANDLQFESQTKTRLNNSEAQTAVYQIFKEGLSTYLEENPSAGKAVIEKVMLSARARMAARAAKDAVVRKSVFESNSLPGKLADCQSRVPAESEIYIVEGDSAGGCFAGETKVALADGRNLSFLELIDEQKLGKTHACYTIGEGGRVEIGKAVFVRKTKTNAQVVQVTLDNGVKITCTPDHKFMLRDGRYCQAQDLKPQASLMPLYKKVTGATQVLGGVLHEVGGLQKKKQLIWDPALETWVEQSKLGAYRLQSPLISTNAGYYPSNNPQDLIANYNHKVVSVTSLSQKIDVYDLEVPGTHNFALASGVFVHNSAKQGRDRKFQAIFPLRGKILNTERARIDRIIASEEIKNLVIALGAGIGESYDPEKLRYHRIILMNDADVDGEHITTLGLTFFFRHLPAIVEDGYLYIAMPPLYKVTHNKVDRYVYSDEDKDALVEQIKTENPNANIGIQRYKGLGEMNPEQLWETTMNPETRMLKKVTIEDLDKADSAFSTLMGDDVVPRKKFIQTHAKLAHIDI